MMSDSGMIRVYQDGRTTSSVYLYTHYRGDEIYGILKRAMSRKERWFDSAYLARIIFCEMVKGDERGVTGAGISALPFCVDHTILGVECSHKEITFEDVDGNIKGRVSFDEFVSRKDKWSVEEREVA
jgi:hypothetical protein